MEAHAGAGRLSLAEGDWDRLATAAHAARANAYAPYSRFSVGAAILTGGGDVFAGCNVENASYGLTVCAERNAIFSAVCHLASPDVVAVYITTHPDVPAAPCGACLQVLAEFASDAEISFVGESGRMISTLRELLPASFRLTSSDRTTGSRDTA